MIDYQQLADAMGYPDFETAIRELMKTLKSGDRVATYVGVCHTTIYKMIKAWGIKLRTGMPYIDIPREDLLRVYAETKSLQKTGEHFGCCAVTIGNRLRQWGIPRNPRGGKHD